MTLNDLYSKTNISDITKVDYNRIPRDNDIRYYKNILFLGEPIRATVVYVFEDGKKHYFVRNYTNIPLPILKRLTHLKIDAINNPESIELFNEFNSLINQVRDAFIFKHTYDIKDLSVEEAQDILDKNRTFLLQVQHYFEQEKLIALVKDL